MMRLSNDGLIAGYTKMVKAVKMHDCRIIAQIALANNYRPDANGTLAPCEIDDLGIAALDDLVELFARGAERAGRAGFDGVQIHAAHGFYLSRCYSPASNHRCDDYGGTPEKRARILVETLKAIRSKAPNLHVSTKINFSDFQPGGVTPADAIVACREPADAGIDSIEVSANGTSRTGVKPGLNEAYFRAFAQELKEVVATPVILVGGHRSIGNMERILNGNKVDYFALSRPLIREPGLVKRWLKGDRNPAACISCNSCYRTPGRRCIFNPGTRCLSTSQHSNWS
jgi:2,4-dienoyl-CoA reductase-like NADH-dependent reductase (Old Yellow Enzyme family)